MTTIKSILEELFDRGERLGRSQWVSEDEKEHAIKEALQQIEQLIEEAKPDRRVNPNKSGYSAASITHGYKNTSSDYFDDGFNGGVNVFNDNLKKAIR